ncbi:protein lifeguard 4-like [Neocloeon triangulifer]|uniref:protein lifeguard 4-like n=1 Tax=Neocloeon triangulifer TaxID=2078957 RepID=UPI00286F6041|nr:protein lifeguard 4-like [Neocloeon triangulifer]
MTTIPLMYADDLESGNEVKYDDDGKNNVLKAHVSIRMAFLRKVYGLVSLQLLFSTIMGAVCLLQPTIREFVHSNHWLVILAMFLSMGILVALHIKRQEAPANFILLSAFTVVQAYTVAVIVTFYEQAAVLQAFLLTTCVVVGLTVYALQTKKDFSSIGATIFAGLWILLIGGLLQIFIQNTLFELALSVGGAILFSFFIIYDTQMIMYKVSPEEYILATITLYMDIINLFLHILRILEAARRQ